MIPKLRVIFARLSSIFQRNSQINDLEEELAAHLEMHAAENQSRGMSREEAYRLARIKLGGLDAVREQCRDQQRIPQFDSIFQDLRFALRFWAKRPLLVLAATVTLALGIGINTTIFSAIDSILLQPIPYPDSDRLVLVSLLDREPKNEHGTRRRLSNTELLELWQKKSSMMSGLAGYSAWMTTVGSGGDPEKIFSALTTPDLFSLFKVTPLMGRLFSPEEARPGSNQVVILAHHYWKNRFGADPEILNQTITLEGKPYVVIGVMGPDFKLYVPGLGNNIGLFCPLSETEGILAKAPMINVVGRLKDGKTLIQAQEELEALTSNFSGNHENLPKKFDIQLTPLLEELYGGYRPTLMIFLGCSICVLLIGCINLMNVIFAQLTGRTKELAMRAALGAKRSRLIQQMLIECLVLVIPGAVLGAVVAAGLIKLLINLYPQQLPRIEYLSWSGENIAFFIGCILFSSLAIGIVPAWRLTRNHFHDSIRQNGSASQSQNRSGAILLTAQTAISLVVLSSAGLLIRSFYELKMTDPGYRREGILTSQVSLPEKTYPTPESHTRLAYRILEQVDSIPGVQSAAITNSMPLVFNLLLSVDLSIPDSSFKEAQRIGCRAVSRDFAKTFGMQLVSGRFFTKKEEQTLDSVVINQQFARKYFGDRSPLGEQIFLRGTSKTIIGVVRDIRNMRLQFDPKPEIYVPFAAYPSSIIDIALHTEGDPAQFARAVRAELRQLDQTLALGQISTMKVNLDQAVIQWSFRAFLLGIFAVMTTGLAAVGIYGVTAYVVRLRNREFGIRMALGAQPQNLLRHILTHGMIAPLVGILIGIPGALATGKWIESMLYGVRPFDPTTYIGVAIFLIVIAVAGILIPALRVTRIDPAATLRAE